MCLPSRTGHYVLYVAFFCVFRSLPSISPKRRYANSEGVSVAPLRRTLFGLPPWAKVLCSKDDRGGASPTSRRWTEFNICPPLFLKGISTDVVSEFDLWMQYSDRTPGSNIYHGLKFVFRVARSLLLCASYWIYFGVVFRHVLASRQIEALESSYCWNMFCKTSNTGRKFFDSLKNSPLQSWPSQSWTRHFWILILYKHTISLICKCPFITNELIQAVRVINIKFLFLKRKYLRIIG